MTEQNPYAHIWQHIRRGQHNGGMPGLRMTATFRRDLEEFLTRIESGQPATAEEAKSFRDRMREVTR
jgi:hypothetical protein